MTATTTTGYALAGPCGLLSRALEEVGEPDLPPLTGPGVGSPEVLELSVLFKPAECAVVARP